MRPIAILGAGLAGLSLADALRERGLRREIVLIDRRRVWERDRTWCTWDTDAHRPLRFTELADHRWDAWSVRSRGREVVARSRHPYIHLDARTVYDAALARLDGVRGIEIRTGERVLAVDAGDPHPEVRTARETFTAELVVDALGPSSPLLRGASPPEVVLSQRFLGWEVRTERPAFDPEVATLMDFREADGDGCNFLYVLPYSATEALVEHTSIGAGGPTAPVRREALRSELAGRGAGAVEIGHEERGLIPMTTAELPAVRGRSVYAAGAAAGGIRASSGYAFTRIQRHVDRLADAIAAGLAPPEHAAPPRLHRLDRVFLRAVSRSADGGESLLAAVAFGVEGDTFARFMTDVADRRDEARVLAALPAAAMARAALGRGHR